MTNFFFLEILRTIFSKTFRFFIGKLTFITFQMRANKFQKSLMRDGCVQGMRKSADNDKTGNTASSWRPQAARKISQVYQFPSLGLK